MISVEQHLDRILGTVKVIRPFEQGVLDAQGCILAEDVRARGSLPGFTNSAMDGYAVHARDVSSATPESPVVLPVVNDIAAGNTSALSLAQGQTMRIMTGAPMPHGADAVVPVEATDGGVVRVQIRERSVVGQHVRELGEDVEAGSVVLKRGTLVGPGQIALLAAAGVPRLRVVPRPRVVVISTGDELVDVGTTPAFGQIVDSNSLMLTAAVTAVGATPFRVGGIPDDARVLMQTLEGQLVRADAIITTGGVSMGAFDTVKEVLSRVGTMQFDKVAMRPGMPQGFGLLGEEQVPVFTLPGNPVSALVSFHVFVAPALRAMAGRPEPAYPPGYVPAVAAEPFTSVPGKMEFVRVVLEDDRARLAGGQGSHMLGALAAADALAVIPESVSAVQAGDPLECLPLLGREGQ
ncbi:molybdotransferase-like divisome protein Glp [Pedococcus sp. 5OH_020]|uniref:molybdotransferase-like divisome protein Glp n=1 Tax=Pedococcus sp. 5OH_020 TaxID=2989814 RepID=UPI0022E9E7BE|nr:gephyrin-like molybdotransferase Glp [Pedococcus sp. 5OH_020]